MNDKNQVSLINKIRYGLLIPIILMVGLITSPFTLMFRWNGFYIFCISVYYWCSLTEAKRLFLKNKDGKYTVTNRDNFQTIAMFSPVKDYSSLSNNSSASMDYIRNTLSYSYNPSNIYYSSSKR